MESGILARKLRRNHQEAVRPQGHGGDLVVPVCNWPSFAGGLFWGSPSDGNPYWCLFSVQGLRNHTVTPLIIGHQPTTIDQLKSMISLISDVTSEVLRLSKCHWHPLTMALMTPLCLTKLTLTAAEFHHQWRSEPDAFPTSNMEKWWKMMIDPWNLECPILRQTHFNPHSNEVFERVTPEKPIDSCGSLRCFGNFN